ncbi:MAG: hypothetical protein NC223_08125 [Butyrivibrio sp.]|nr:hypothetical protein [Butyrivibrio sp.]
MVLKEFARLFKNSTFVMIFISLAFLAPAITYVNEIQKNNESSCSAKEYKSVYSEIEGMEASEAEAYLEKRYSEKLYAEEEESFFAASGYGIVLDEVRQCVTYDEYLERIREDALRYGSVSIFASDDSYSERNIYKTASRFERLIGNKLETGPSKGINMLTDNIIIDIVAAVIIFAAATVLFMQEKDNKSLALIKACGRGRVHSALSRLGAAAMCCAAVMAALYLPLAFMSCKMYGFGSLNRLIQSVAGFVTTDINMSVGFFLVSYFITKFTVYLTLAFVFCMIMNAVGNLQAAYAATAAAAAAEVVLYAVIPDNSRLMFFKNINLYAWLNTYRIFNTYRNLRIMSYPIDYRVVSAAVQLLLIPLCAGATVLMWNRHKGAHDGRLRPAVRIYAEKLSLWNRIKNTGPALNELYRIAVKCGGFVIIAAAAFFLWKTSFFAQSPYDSIDDVYYSMVIGQVEGDYTEEKIALIKEKRRELTEGTADIRENSAPYWLKAYDSVLLHAEYESGIDGGALIYDRVYERLTGKDIGTELLLAIEAVIILILAGAVIWAPEYAVGMDRLVRTAKHGRRRLDGIRWATAFLLCAAIFAGTHLPWLISQIKMCNTDYFDSKVRILEHLSNMPAFMTIRGYLLIACAAKIIILCLISVFIKYSAVKTRSRLMSVILPTAAFVLPLIILKIFTEISQVFN